jgi:putative ABC transport system permease protein
VPPPSTWVELLPRSDLDLPPEPKIYVVYGHDLERDRQLVVRGDGVGGAEGQARLSLSTRREIESAAPWGMRSPPVRRWLEGYDSTRQTSGFLASLFAAFGTFGLLLCAVGMYGVLAYTVSRPMRELATRVALGAQSRDVVTMGVALTKARSGAHAVSHAVETSLTRQRSWDW